MAHDDEMAQKMAEMRAVIDGLEGATYEDCTNLLEAATGSPAQAESALINLHAVLANQPRENLEAWARVQPAVAGALLGVYMRGGSDLLARLDRTWDFMRGSVSKDDWARFESVGLALAAAEETVRSPKKGPTLTLVSD